MPAPLSSSSVTTSHLPLHAAHISGVLPLCVVDIQLNVHVYVTSTPLQISVRICNECTLSVHVKQIVNCKHAIFIIIII